MDSKAHSPSHKDTLSKRNEQSQAPPEKSAHQHEQLIGNSKFLINKEGAGNLILPRSFETLQTQILNENDSVLYVSRRYSEKSGDCVLLDSFQNEIIKTQYRFGPGRSPTLHYCEPSLNTSSIKVRSRFGTRDVSFSGLNGSQFEWRYEETKLPGTESIILWGKDHNHQIAAFWKSAATSTDSSTSTLGELVINLIAKGIIDESLIIATCLIMIKRERDQSKVGLRGMSGMGGGLFL